MNLSRRWFLRALVAAPLVPIAAKLAAATELVAAKVPLPQTRWTPNDIIAATIESRSRQIADNIYQNNVLLQTLRNHDRRMRTEPAYRRAHYADEFRHGARWKWNYGSRQSVRVDSRCPSGFAAWRDSLGRPPLTSPEG